jgi:hypothetical protein
MFNKLIRLLLPESWFWQSSTSELGKLWNVIASTADNAKNYLLNTVRDATIATTQKLDKWEEELNLPFNSTLTEQERRNRITGKLLQNNNGSINSIQTKLQAYGFNLFVHNPYQGGSLVNPATYLSTASSTPATLSLADDDAVLAGDNAFLNHQSTLPQGYPLANIDYKISTYIISLADDDAVLGGDNAVLNYATTPAVISEERIQYTLPTDPSQYQYFIYIGGSQFGDFATISKARRNELEQLLLQITPCHIWIGMLITYI